MKKLLTIIIGILLIGVSHACKYDVQPTQGTVKTTAILNIRKQPCLGTKVFGRAPVNKEYKVIGKSNGYYQVIINGEKVFIWEKGVDYNSKYFISEKKKIIINKLVQIIAKYPISKRIYQIDKLKALLSTFKKDSRKRTLIKLIVDGLENSVQIQYSNNNNDDENDLGKYWMSLYNDYRGKLGLKEYKYSKKLEETAKERAKISAQRGYYSHKRDKNDGYYDYNKIVNWFAQRGVRCENIGRVTVLENIGYGVYRCPSGNCPNELKKTVKKTFDNYLKEKGRKNRAHYNSIVNKTISYIGFGNYKKKIRDGVYGVYNVTHFCTEFK